MDNMIVIIFINYPCIHYFPSQEVVYFELGLAGGAGGIIYGGLPSPIRWYALSKIPLSIACKLYEPSSLNRNARAFLTSFPRNCGNKSGSILEMTGVMRLACPSLWSTCMLSQY